MPVEAFVTFTKVDTPTVFDMELRMIGYFQLSSADVVGKFKQAISGELKDRTDKLSERRKAYVIRQKSVWG